MKSEMTKCMCCDICCVLVYYHWNRAVASQPFAKVITGDVRPYLNVRNRMFYSFILHQHGLRLLDVLFLHIHFKRLV
jgi:hypothetical protein